MYNRICYDLNRPLNLHYFIILKCCASALRINAAHGHIPRMGLRSFPYSLGVYSVLLVVLFVTVRVVGVATAQRNIPQNLISESTTS